ncbi:hypothetical protein BRO54_1936 [Geobacillus proteiniphilus]|uniref:Uncharacterized protein n=1 Tax=Geobacillus proteiniphilus TaxID=860353 RepID=A0A1Q5SZN0_9BACL|nr:hypothetical protein BRO54_1936 [Geobacillus proteiniphilus]
MRHQATCSFFFFVSFCRNKPVDRVLPWKTSNDFLFFSVVLTNF